MSVGFGFSVGDFISAIELVGTVIDALRSSSNASLEYRELIRQLLSLETALIQVKRLEFEEGQYAEVNALREAAGLCRRTIDNFLKKIEKYQPSLNGASGDGRSIRDIWMKVKWARCKKEDVAGFKADLVGHTESIQLLLTTVQM
jgi:chromosome segregation ATPase